MKSSGPSRPAHDELLDQLMVAAREQDQQLRAAQRPRRRRRRGLIVLVAIGLGTAAAAGATDLISVGEPVPDRSLREMQDTPREGVQADLVATAPDPAGGASWGIGLYRSKTGRTCFLAGQLRGRELGLIRGGSFRPYERGTSGSCATTSAFTHDRLMVAGAEPRTVVYGVAADKTRRVTATLNGKTYTARPARDGAFLFVFSGRLALDEPRLGLGARINP